MPSESNLKIQDILQHSTEGIKGLTKQKVYQQNWRAGAKRRVGQDHAAL